MSVLLAFHDVTIKAVMVSGVHCEFTIKAW